LQQADTRNITRLPLSAVMNDAKGPMVWVVEPSSGKLERRAVSVESFGQENAVVSSGLKNGEQVVTLGVHTLDSAMTVRVVEMRAASFQ
jgi:multidrug efflux pump subunit AcrA (membrane-fusion protein)